MDALLPRSWTAVLAVLTVLLDGYALVRAISRDYGVERTLAWIFAILAFPIIGALVYLALASPSLRRTTRRKLRGAAATRRAMGEGADIAPEELADEHGLFALGQRITGLAPTSGNRVTLLAEHEQAFEQIEGALDGARRRIWAEYYIVQNDATGRRFLGLLAKKAAEGVEVRFLYDAVGSLRIDAGRLAAIREAGGKTIPFQPLNPWRRRWSIHLRNHRKLVIVDDERVFTGGMNIGDEYSGRARGGPDQHFRDTHLEIEGPAVAGFNLAFAEDWAFATNETLDPTPPDACDARGHAFVGPLPSGPDQRYNASWMVFFSAIAAARRRVHLTSPYFIPDEALEGALASAAMRGVDVRVLVPARSDVRLVGAAGRSYCRALMPTGVRVFHYRPSMLHTKTLLIDDDVCVVGSANMDIRSFRLNFELGALVRDAELARQLEERFEQDLAQSEEWSMEAARGAKLWNRVGDRFARLLSPVL